MGARQAATPRRSRLGGLEVARGIAATAVVFFHVGELHLPVPSGMGREVVYGLGKSVPVFFAISAFSLLYGYSSTLWTKEGMRRFYWRRAFRILPLFYLMLLVYVGRAHTVGQYIPRSEILLNVFFLFPFFPGKHESLVWAGWSLGVEWIFYLVFPLFAVVCERIAPVAIAFVIACLLVHPLGRIIASLMPGSSYSVMNVPLNFVFFFAGGLAFALVRAMTASPRSEAWTVRIRNSRHAVIVATIAILCLYNFVVPRAPDFVPYEVVLGVVCVPWMILAFVGLPSWADNLVTRRLGRLSYGIYLLHPLVLWMLGGAGLYTWIASILGGPGWLAFLAGVW